MTPSADVRVSNLRLVNGSAMNPACDAYKQKFSGMVPGSAANCTPAYFNYGTYIGLLGNFPGLAEELNYPELGDEVRARPLYNSSPIARNKPKSRSWPPSLMRRESVPDVVVFVVVTSVELRVPAGFRERE